MSNKEQIKLMKEVRDIIDKLDDTTLLSIGINATEYLNPTEKTSEKLKPYQAKVNKEKIERLDISL